MKTKLFFSAWLLLTAGCGDVLPTAQSADALDMTQLNPGHSLELKGAILGELECLRYFATCQVDHQKFGVRTVAGPVPFSRGRGGLYREYEFDVAAGAGNGNVLMGQVCGAVEFNGFLGLVGGGQVSTDLRVKLIDLGPAYAPYAQPRVVHCESLAGYALQGKVVNGVGGGISGEFGTSFTAGASLDVHLGIEIQKEVIRDDIDFGFQALLVRGHRYRVRCEVEAESKIDALTGFGIAQFMEGGPILNLMLPVHWRQSVLSLLNSELLPAFIPGNMVSAPVKPSIPRPALAVMGPGWLDFKEDVFDLKMLEIDGLTAYLSEWTTRLVPNFTDLHQLMETKGIPIDLNGLVEIVGGHIVKGIGNNVEELLENPGVTVHRISVTLQNDNTELLEAIRHEMAR